MEKRLVEKKLYVGGLNYNVDDGGLRELFEPFGKVESAKVIKDFHTGDSKGFGFVEMSTLEEAKKAIDALNGTEHKGRSITVSEAKPLDPNNRGGRGGPPRSGGNHPRRSGDGGSRY